MVARKKTVALAAALAILATPLVDATAQTRRLDGNYAYQQGYRPVPTGNWNYGVGYGLGYGLGGDYGTGWRDRNNARGWDNTCINAPWLPSQYACSPK
jgi:hypothetical protein